jgi:hypothetical protein
LAARELARVLSAGRLAIGVGLLVAPRLSLGMWIGRDAAAGSVSAPARALGIREVALGTMALHVVDEPGVGAGLLRTLAVCDGVDLLATLAARRSLPPAGVLLIAALAGAGAAGQLWVAAQLDAAAEAAGPPASAR